MAKHPESPWTHAICDCCWARRDPLRVPHRLVEREEEKCCFCGKQTTSGIYIREDPAFAQFCADP